MAKTTKTQKGAPKLKQTSRQKGKYAAQYIRTYNNKIRRIRHHNGVEALARWMEAHSLKASHDGFSR